jgi:splicing suppressor protein 51
MDRKLALRACADCQILHHCSDCSDTHSKAVCASYKIQNQIERFRHELFEDTGKASVIACTSSPSRKYKSLAECTGWYDYYVNVSDKAFIKGNIMPDFSNISSSAAQRDVEMREFEEQRRMFLQLATDTLTMPLSILAALEDLQLLKLSTLKIHLLGATGREFLGLSSFEEILHLNPALKNLDITAVGPSSWLYGQGPDGYAPKEKLPSCAACQSQGRTRPLSAYKGLYHDFATTRFYEKPDLIVAFNSGCVDGDDADDDWDRTIRLIVDSGIPALFTTYNPREAWNEQVKMKSLDAKFVVEPEKNKWSSLVPMPEFLDEEFEMWHQNHHRYVIKGKQK